MHVYGHQVANRLASADRIAAARESREDHPVIYVRRQRLDHAHKTALALVRAHDLIVHKDLQIKNVTARPKTRPDGSGGFEPNGAAAKAGLNSSRPGIPGCPRPSRSHRSAKATRTTITPSHPGECLPRGVSIHGVQ
jgi:hypothetical protein